jgi:peptidoglycan/LPS O-acetylase OafA/YrhL
VAALDGLRGLAMVAVLLFHGGVGWARGGFLGVSTFFTLSGFLITSLLMAEYRSTGRISLRLFLAGRVRRLLPAALVTLLGVVVFARTVATTSQLAGLRSDTIAALVYVSNWRFALTGRSYDGAPALSSPVQHFWSLGIEEQFYLALPLVLMAAIRVGPAPHRVVAIGASVLIVASVGLAMVVTGDGGHTARAHFGTDVRAAELLVGVLAAVLVHRLASWSRRAVVLRWGGPVALLVVVAAWMTVDQRSIVLYQGGLFVYAVMSVIVVLACFQAGPLKTVLELRPLRWLGRISYAAYLYHWPIYLVLTPDRLGVDGMPLLSVRMGTSFVVAYLSTMLLEEPIRRQRLWPRSEHLGPGPVAMGLVSALVVTILTMPSVPLDIGPSGVPVAAGERVRAAPSNKPTVTIPVAVPVERLLLVGDSITHQSAPFFAARFPDSDVRWVGRNGMGLLTDQGRLLDILDEAIATFDPDVVLIESVGVYTAEGESDPYLSDQGTPVDDGSEQMFVLWQQQAERAVAVARSRGALVVWATTAPIQEQSYFGSLASRVERLNDIYRRLDDVTIVDWWAGTAPGGRFSAELRPPSGDIRTARSFDGLHFTEFGNELLVDMAEPAIAGYAGRTTSRTR